MLFKLCRLLTDFTILAWGSLKFIVNCNIPVHTYSPFCPLIHQYSPVDPAFPCIPLYSPVGFDANCVSVSEIMNLELVSQYKVCLAYRL